MPELRWLCPWKMNQNHQPSDIRFRRGIPHPVCHGNVLHKRHVLPLLAATSSRQQLLFFVSYSMRITFTLSSQARLSASARVRRKRSCSARTRRRAARQSASYRDVICLNVDRSAWLGSVEQVDVFYGPSSVFKSQHSSDAARSDAEASLNRRRHTLRVVQGASRRSNFTGRVNQMTAWSEIMSQIVPILLCRSWWWPGPVCVSAQSHAFYRESAIQAFTHENHNNLSDRGIVVYIFR